MQSYPSWRYHRTAEPVIVEHPEADQALGGEWADTPAAFLDEEEPSEPEPAAAAPAPRKRKKTS